MGQDQNDDAAKRVAARKWTRRLIAFQWVLLPSWVLVGLGQIWIGHVTSAVFAWCLAAATAAAIVGRRVELRRAANAATVKPAAPATEDR